MFNYTFGMNQINLIARKMKQLQMFVKYADWPAFVRGCVGNEAH